MSVLAPAPLELTAEDVGDWLAARPGLYIFPSRLIPDGSGQWIKRPLVRWTAEATADPAEATALWRRQSGERGVVSIACAPSKLWVLDVDREVDDPDWQTQLDGVDTLVLRSCTKALPHYVFRQGEPMVGEGKWEYGDVKSVGMIVLSSHEPIRGAWDAIAEAPPRLIARLETSRLRGSKGHPALSNEELWNWLVETPDDLILPADGGDAFLRTVISNLTKKVEAGEHRRQACRDTVFQAGLEASAGYYPAEKAFEQILQAYEALRDADGSWTYERKRDYESMWATLVPQILAGDLATEISDLEDRVGAAIPPELQDYWQSLIHGSNGADYASKREPENSAPASSVAYTDKTPAQDVRTTSSADPESGSTTAKNPPLTHSADSLERAWSVADVRAETEDLDKPKEPTLAEAALWGPHGELVMALRGRTECADIGVLVSLIACCGATLGGRGHLRIGTDVHGPNVYCQLIGASSSARKSSALALAQHVYFEIDDDRPGATIKPSLWLPRRLSGLASGERLIHVWAPIKEAVKRDDGTEEPPELPERRVLIIEQEASAFWKKARRDGSVLTDIVCRMWDQTQLSNLALTTGSVTVEKEHHLAGFLGASTLHVTRQTLSGGDGVDALSGFGNRFLWFFLPDSLIDLPFGAELPKAEIQRYRTALKLYDLSDVAGVTSGFGPEFTLTDDARELWSEVYGSLKRDKGVGLVEGLISRAESQTLRLALNYALASGAHGVVGVEPLNAALALWDYAKASVEHLFAGAAMDERVDALRAEILEQGGWLPYDDLKYEFPKGVLARLVEKGVQNGVLRTGICRMPGRSGKAPKIVGLASGSMKMTGSGGLLYEFIEWRN